MAGRTWKRRELNAPHKRHRKAPLREVRTTTAICCLVNPSYSLWKDKAPALNYPKPEPKSRQGRNAAAVKMFSVLAMTFS